jgi:glycosyltransferase A (GT-A) superfamily protein (DUF2064 family)
MSAVLYVAARAPRPGFAKTRLGKAIGHEQANMLYAAFVRDLAARLADAPFPVGWYVTPEDAWGDLAGLVYPLGEAALSLASGTRPSGGASSGSQDGVRASVAIGQPGPLVGPILVQGPGDWAARQQALFAGAPGRGEQRTILIASDSPQLTLDPILEAFALLADRDLVLGPVDDGGYYLIGMRGPWDVLGGVRMSTGTVLDEIVARAERLGLSVAFVAPTFDVDEAEDLARLAALALDRDDLPATKSALERLGLLRDSRDDMPVLSA